MQSSEAERMCWHTWHMRCFGLAGLLGNAKQSSKEVFVPNRVKAFKEIDICAVKRLHEMAYMVSDRRPDPFEKLFLNQQPRFKDPKSIPINIKEVLLP